MQLPRVGAHILHIKQHVIVEGVELFEDIIGRTNTSADEAIVRPGNCARISFHFGKSDLFIHSNWYKVTLSCRSFTWRWRNFWIEREGHL
jgi:hypothetical protein